MVLTNEFRLGTITRKDTGTHIIDNFGMGYEKRKKLDLQVTLNNETQNLTL